MFENILVGLIVLSAVIWAVRAAVKEVRQRQTPAPGCSCSSSSHCATLAARRKAVQREAEKAEVAQTAKR